MRSFIQFSLPILIGTTILIIFGCYLSGCLTIAALFTMVMSAILSYHDIKTCSYPVWLWVLFQPFLISLGHWQLATTILLLLAILTECYDCKIGSGDILYLASLSLVLTLENLLWTIQIGSFLALVFLLISRQKGVLPFLPFLSLAYAIVHIL